MQDLRRLILRPALVALWLLAACVSHGESLRVTTWNLHDFPSGVYNLRKPEVEPENIRKAAEVISERDPEVLLLEEIRDGDACRALIEALKPRQYHLAVCSEFKDVAGIPQFQQVAIVSKRPALKAGWGKWKTQGVVEPPRGFAYAVFQMGDETILFYALHLKSNRSGGGDPERETQLNILKRELAMEQLLRHAEEIGSKMEIRPSTVVVGGDMNTNGDNVLFASERTLGLLRESGFQGCFDQTQFQDRITCPGKGRYPDATFDYIFFRGMTMGAGPNVTPNRVSDHNPVTCVLSSAVSPKSGGVQAETAKTGH
jgi:endonuclease/exonuclease/phosphatase family metal-dependent hydrolase